ncbi:hypothetical protein [Endozoicomonas sp. Mp262]|uniref:hypothetical protein n=1 Tax=Endozoicomonas sp. Mp262 TaxID=2919499 RepID=UPI0021D90CE6
MLNEALYDCLVELGANKTRAHEAAKENAKLNIIELKVSETHQGVYQLTRQTAEINDRLIVLERGMKEVKGEVSGLKDRVTGLETRMENMETRMESMETRMESMETRMESMETRMESMETRMENMETRMENMETRMESIETRMINIEGMLKILVDRG